MKSRALLLLFTAMTSAGCEDEQTSADAAVASWQEELAYPNGHPVSSPDGSPEGLSIESELARLMNEHRIGKGLTTLAHDGDLSNVARAHAKHMIVHDFFAHVNPEGDSPGSRLTIAGVSWNRTGENIAVGYGTVQEAFDAWLASPSHRATLEDPAWTHFGSGYWHDPADGGSVVYGRYYVQDFLRRP